MLYRSGQYLEEMVYGKRERSQVGFEYYVVQ